MHTSRQRSRLGAVLAALALALTMLVATASMGSALVPPEADISVTKTDGVTSAVPGQDTIIYTIVVSNAGPDPDPSVAVADTFPAALTCSWTSLAAGGATGHTSGSPGTPAIADTLDMPVSSSVTYTVDCSIDPAATGTLSNTVTATASVIDPGPGANTATDNNTVLTPKADISVTKTDGVTGAVPGQDTLIYTIVVTNNGPSRDPSVVVADTFPAALTCSWTSVASGGATGNSSTSGSVIADTLAMPPVSSVTYTVPCAIDPAATGTLSNTATATASVTDPGPGANTATDNNTVLTPTADISVTKTDGVTAAVPGQDTITYTIVVTNNGPSDDPSVGVADTFPAALTCSWTSVASGGATGNDATGSGDIADTLVMPPGSSVTYTANCSIPSGATGTLSNTASAVASVTDPGPGVNTATDNNTVLTPTADISVTKTDGITTAVPGGALTYTIVVSNAGPSRDPLVAVADSFPAALTCLWTSAATGGATGNDAVGAGNIVDALAMPPASSVTYTVQCTIDPAATGTLSNTATAAASVTDPNPTNNSATDGNTALPGLLPDFETVGLVDTSRGVWRLRNSVGVVKSFFFGDPGDLPAAGDWKGNGVTTPGLYRQSDGFFYTRDSNTEGPADAECFAGNPADIPVVGDWDGNGTETLGLYRPGEQKFYLFNTTCKGSPLGAAALSFAFGNPGDLPFAADFDDDGVTEVGLFRPANGFVYYRDTLTTGAADHSFFWGDPGDRVIGGNWDGVGGDSVGLFRPGDGKFYLRNSNTQGTADTSFAFGTGTGWPIAGHWGLG